MVPGGSDGPGGVGYESGWRADCRNGTSLFLQPLFPGMYIRSRNCNSLFCRKQAGAGGNLQAVPKHGAGGRKVGRTSCYRLLRMFLTKVFTRSDCLPQAVASIGQCLHAPLRYKVERVATNLYAGLFFIQVEVCQSATGPGLPSAGACKRPPLLVHRRFGYKAAEIAVARGANPTNARFPAGGWLPRRIVSGWVLRGSHP